METKTSISSLILINNDRYEGYKMAAGLVEDAQMKKVFKENSEQSRKFMYSLDQFSDTDDHPKHIETTHFGKLYRIWMDVKNYIAAKDYKAVLTSCEHAEDAFKEAYNEVLDDPGDVAEEVIEIIRRHRAELQPAHDTIKAMHDSIQ